MWKKSHQRPKKVLMYTENCGDTVHVRAMMFCTQQSEPSLSTEPN